MHLRQRATQGHRVLTLAELAAAPPGARVALVCATHHQPQVLFDTQCEKLVCVQCVLEQRATNSSR